MSGAFDLTTLLNLANGDEQANRTLVVGGIFVLLSEVSEALVEFSITP